MDRLFAFFRHTVDPNESFSLLKRGKYKKKENGMGNDDDTRNNSSFCLQATLEMVISQPAKYV